jgi:hypothetical protein
MCGVEVKVHLCTRCRWLACLRTAQYSDWLRADRVLVGFDSRQGSLFTNTSRPSVGPTQPITHWVPGVKRPERKVDHTCIWCLGWECVEIQLHSPKIFISWGLSTGTPLPSPFYCCHGNFLRIQSGWHVSWPIFETDTPNSKQRCNTNSGA